MAKAGTITINLSAGTAQFVLDMERANAKLDDFGRRGKAAGDHAVSSIQATSGALRVLEGSGGIRAAERFLADTLGLGNAFQKLFPAIGALALLDTVFIKLGTEAFKFFQQIQQGPERVAGAFRDLNAPLQLTNDQLAVTNDRLANDIAKLEGKHENTLKLALDEARAAADKLAESLDKDLAGLNKLLKEEQVGLFKSLFAGARTDDLRKEIGGDTGRGGFTGRVDAVTDEGNAKIAAATTLKQKDAAQLELNARLVGVYSEEIGTLEDRLRSAEKAQEAHNRTGGVSGSLNNAGLPRGGAISFSPDNTINIEETRAALRNLQAQRNLISLSATNNSLTDKKSGLEAGKSEAEQLVQQLKASYDSRLAVMEAAESLLASERLEFKQEELRQIIQGYGQKTQAIKNLENQLRLEIGHLSQQAFAEAKAARDKDEKDEEHYQEELSRTKIEWAKRNYEIIAKTYRELSGERPTEPRPDLPQTQIAGDAATRLRGTAFGNILAVSKAGYASAQEQEAAIEKEKDLLATMQAMNAPLNQQYEVRRKILEMQIQMNGRAEAERDALIQTQVQEELRLGTLKSGTRAFFLEMQEQAEKPGKILYDGLNSALDRVTSQFAKFATGQKTSFGKVFQDLGEQIVESSIKSIAKRGIGALGKALGINIPGLQRQDGQTAPGALWVQLANNSATTPQQNNPTAAQSIDFGKIFGGSKGGGIFNFLGGLAGQLGGSFGGGGDGGSSGDGLTPDVSSSISYGGAYATGGDINPGSAYLVGENGPEMVVPRGSGTVIPNGGLGGTHITNYIDARGTDPVLTEQRTRSAMLAVHRDAIVTSIQANNELAKRTPG